MTGTTDKDPARQLVKELHQQRDELIRLLPEKALQRILDARHPAALVHALAEEDLRIMVNDIGADDALPVLAMAATRQWEHLLDAEGWAGDRLALDSADRWIDRLYRADPDRLVHWLSTEYSAFLELYLYRTIEVFLREHDQDPSTLPPECLSLDDTFYYRIVDLSDTQDLSPRDPELCRRLAAGIIERMAAEDHSYCQKILLEAMSVIPAELEEEQYRLRNVRMAEKGFLPFEEAVGIYQPLSVGPDAPWPLAAPAPAVTVPLLPMVVSSAPGHFATALAHLGPEMTPDDLPLAFAALCNRIGVADQAVVNSRQDLERIVSKATGFLNIAIAQCCGGDHAVTPQAAAVIVTGRPVADLFRVGYSAAATLRKRAVQWRAVSWFQREHLPLAFWGERWMGVLGGLLINRPRYFDNYRSGVIYREFAALSEIDETRDTLAAAMTMDGLLGAIALSPPRIKSPPLTYKNLLITAWARDRFQLPGDLTPVDAGTLRRFMAWLWNADSPPFTIDDTRRTALLDWLARRAETTTESVAERFGALLEGLFKEIEDELGRVSIADLEPRYVSALLLAEGHH